MFISREENDAWCTLLGETRKKLDLIDTEVDAIRSKLEAEGRGHSAVWKSFFHYDDDDDEFEDHRPMTRPTSPPKPSSGNYFTQLKSNGDEI